MSYGDAGLGEFRGAAKLGEGSMNMFFRLSANFIIPKQIWPFLVANRLSEKDARVLNCGTIFVLKSNNLKLMKNPKTYQ